MKGTIHYCLEESIIDRFGKEAWDKVCIANGYEVGFSYGTKIRDDIDEIQSIELFVISANTLNIELTELFDIFGEHWCVTYSPRVYGVFYRGMSSTRDAIVKLDDVHDKVTRHIEGALPPRFDYSWVDENVLEVGYNSDRNLIDLFISLIKGLDKKFGNHTKITKLSDKKVSLEFDSPEDPLETKMRSIENPVTQ